MLLKCQPSSEPTSHFCDAVVLKSRSVLNCRTLYLRIFRVIRRGAQAMYKRGTKTRVSQLTFEPRPVTFLRSSHSTPPPPHTLHHPYTQPHTIKRRDLGDSQQRCALALCVFLYISLSVFPSLSLSLSPCLSLSISLSIPLSLSRALALSGHVSLPLAVATSWSD